MYGSLLLFLGPFVSRDVTVNDIPAVQTHHVLNYLPYECFQYVWISVIEKC